MHAYAERHGDGNDSACWRPKAKPIALTVVCIIIFALATYWLIVGPIFESQKHNAKIDRGERNCDK